MNKQPEVEVIDESEVIDIRPVPVANRRARIMQSYQEHRESQTRALVLPDRPGGFVPRRRGLFERKSPVERKLEDKAIQAHAQHQLDAFNVASVSALEQYTATMATQAVQGIERLVEETAPDTVAGQVAEELLARGAVRIKEFANETMEKSGRRLRQSE